MLSVYSICKKIPSISWEQAAKVLQVWRSNIERSRDAQKAFCLEHGLDSTYRQVSQCYNPMEDYYFRLVCIDEIVQGYGVEYIDEIDTEYINFGDAYAPTLCYINGMLIISSWADLIEAHECAKGDDYV